MRTIRPRGTCVAVTVVVNRTRTRLTRDCRGGTQLEGVFLAGIAASIALAAVVPLGAIAGGRFVENDAATAVRQRASSNDSSRFDDADVPSGQSFAMQQRESNSEALRQWTDENVTPFLEWTVLRPAKRLLWLASTLIPLDKVRAYAEWRGIDSDEMEAYERYREPIDASLSAAKDDFVAGASALASDLRNDWWAAVTSRGEAAIAPWREDPAHAAFNFVASPFVLLYSRGSEWNTFLFTESDAESSQAAARLAPGVVAELGAGALTSVSALGIKKKIGNIREARQLKLAAEAERRLSISPNIRRFDPAKDWLAFRAFLDSKPDIGASVPIGWRWPVFVDEAAKHARAKERGPESLFLHRAEEGGREKIVGGVIVRQGDADHSPQVAWLAGMDARTRTTMVWQALHASELAPEQTLRVRPVRGHETLFTREGFLPNPQAGEHMFEIDGHRAQQILRSVTQAPAE